MIEKIKLHYTERIKNLDGSINIKGLNGSLYAFIANAFITKDNNTILFIIEDKEKAEYFLNDLQNIVKTNKRILLFPSSYKKHYQGEIDNSNLLERVEVLNEINKDIPLVIVSYPEALFEKVITPENFKKNILEIKLNAHYSIGFITEMLYEYEFSYTDFVSQPGEFAVRGGIIDVFSYSNEYPYRLEFFGDEVESIRTFDIETQLSIEHYTEIEIIPNIIKKENIVDSRISFFETLPKNARIFLSDYNNYIDRLNAIITKLSDKDKHLFISADNIKEGITTKKYIEINTSHIGDYNHIINIHSLPQPIFNKNIEMLKNNLKDNIAKGIENVIFFTDDKQRCRLERIMEDTEGNKIQFTSVLIPLHKGFIDMDNKVACYTDHEIFERYHSRITKSASFKSQAITLKELTNLNKGDFVTHIDHGIGIFAGLQKIDISGKFKEAIKIEYAGGDTVYVNIHSLHKISKFNSKDGTRPTIHKLGSNVWSNIKSRTKKKVKTIAYDLIKLYAQRKTQRGYSFSPDSYLQYELEASFMYEDTEDQAKASAAVKHDMEQEIPMDRLVCGDVGFGKTEIAIRAAFKAACDSKQTVILVPTTILSFQHYRTFKERLKDFPVNVEYINRFRSAKEKSQILANLETGKIDIIIGTHRIVDDKIKYKNLGLLIIDEEQKFGVAIKDKLKVLKVNLDTLTLTATPIPRTLQFSLMSARDLSIIATPPPNRYPIETEVIRFDNDIIKEAIIHEMARGGQIFFVHNRISNLEYIANIIKGLVPNIRIAIGHGQMDGNKLENIIIDFMNGDYDLLLTTSIIENGIDIPNANTIIINDSHRFGLSDLHQMRGRVGRSNKKAYCYFISPPYTEMTQESRRRLQALEMFSDIGQGFNIAMKDLEIRGAGDLLGAEQSGFIADIGFETYEKILVEAMLELKDDNDEFVDIFDDNTNDSMLNLRKEVFVDTDFEAFFPDTYINSTSEKIILYRELSKINNMEELQRFKYRLQDRFGKFDIQVENLFKVIELKWLSQEIGLYKLIIKAGKMSLYFNEKAITNTSFGKVIDYITANPNLCKMIQEKDKSILTINMVKTLERAREILQNMSL